jgi:hypothetical protein
MAGCSDKCDTRFPPLCLLLASLAPLLPATCHKAVLLLHALLFGVWALCLRRIKGFPHCTSPVRMAMRTLQRCCCTVVPQWTSRRCVVCCYDARLVWVWGTWIRALAALAFGSQDLGCTPLYAAASEDHLGVATKLLDHGAVVNSSSVSPLRHPTPCTHACLEVLHVQPHCVQSIAQCCSCFDCCFLILL